MPRPPRLTRLAQQKLDQGGGARHDDERAATSGQAAAAEAAELARQRGENSWARIWHSYLIFAASVLLAAAGPAACPCILAGHRRLAGGSRPGGGSAQAAPAVQTPLPYVSRAWSPHRPDLGEWVAGPGFEPGRLSSAILQTAPLRLITSSYRVPFRRPGAERSHPGIPAEFAASPRMTRVAGIRSQTGRYECRHHGRPTVVAAGIFSICVVCDTWKPCGKWTAPP